MTEAKYRLTELEIDEGSLVDKGDNPEAHVRLFKNEPEGEGAEGDAEAVTDPKVTIATVEANDPGGETVADNGPETADTGEQSAEGETEKAAPRGVFRRLWDWVAGAPDPAELEKMMPRTTGEILRATRWESDFADLRRAFMESIDSILEYTAGPDVSPMLAKTVAEFAQEADRITAEIEKRDANAAIELRALLDRIAKTGSKGGDEPDGRELRANFAKAIADLESFEVPPIAREIEEMSETTKTLETVLAGMSDEDRAIVDAEIAKAGHADMGGKKKPAFLEDDEDKAKADKAEKAETEKAEADAIAKRFAEIEKRAADAEAKVAEMVAKERAAEFFAKARKIVPGGVDHAELAGALQKAADLDPELGATLETLFGALGSQVAKGRLFEVIGSEAPIGKAADAHSRLEARAIELRKAAAERGETMTAAEAYDAAMMEAPELAAEAIG